MFFVYTLLPGLPPYCIAVFPDSEEAAAREFCAPGYRDLRRAEWVSGRLPEKFETKVVPLVEEEKS